MFTCKADLFICLLERFDFPKVLGKVNVAIESGIPDLTKLKSDTILHRLGSAKPWKMARKSLEFSPRHQQKKIVWVISREFQDLDSGFWISRGASILQLGLSYFQNHSRLLNCFEKPTKFSEIKAPYQALWYNQFSKRTQQHPDLLFFLRCMNHVFLTVESKKYNSIIDFTII